MKFNNIKNFLIAFALLLTNLSIVAQEVVTDTVKKQTVISGKSKKLTELLQQLVTILY